jgi:Na+/melibiose symporter-like transporter
VPTYQPTLTPSTIRWYGLGMLPVGIIIGCYSFLVFYYTQVLGLRGSLVGLAALLASLFDAVTDPVAGILSDRTGGRLGRRHPYLFSSALLIAVVFYLLWVPPAGLGEIALFAWLLGFGLLARLVNTFYVVPHLALGAELSADYEERNTVVMARSILINVGRAAAGALLLLVFLRPTAEYPDGQLNPAAYPRFALLFGVVILVALVASAWKTRSRVPFLSSPGSAPPGGMVTSLLRNLREAVRHRPFRAILMASVSAHIGWGISDSLGLYLATYFWKVSMDVLFIWGLCMFAGMFAGMPFWRRVAARRDKREVYLLGLAIYLLFFGLPHLCKVFGFWPEAESVLYIPLYCITSGFCAHFGTGALSVVAGSMIADVTDLDELRCGRRREGVFFGAESFAWKALAGFGALFAGLVVDFVGLSPGMGAEDAGPEMARNLGLSLGVAMTVLMGLAIVSISRYDLDRARHARIRAGLDARDERRS